MTNKDKLFQMIDNLNKYGADTLFDLLENFDKIEQYNINTTPERIAELHQIETQKAELEKEEREEKQKEVERRKQEIIEEYSEFFKNIKATKVGKYLTDGELNALHMNSNGNWFYMIYDSFRAGFLRGQRAEKARVKRHNEKERAC